MARIHLIALLNDRGLGQDLPLLRNTLESLGHRVEVTSIGGRRNSRRWRAWWLGANMALRWLLSFGRLQVRYDLATTL